MDEVVSKNLNDLHTKQAENFNKKKREGREFDVGTQVLVIKPKEVGGNKISRWWTGPHIITKQAGQSVWEVDVGNKCRQVHEAQMKPHYEPLQGHSWPLHHKMLTDKDVDPDSAHEEWVVDKIIKHRKRPDGQVEFLTRWQGYSAEDDTWELAPQFLPRVNLDFVNYCRKHKLDMPIQALFEQSQ